MFDHYYCILYLCILVQCSSSKIIDSFAVVGRVPELTKYLHQLVYDDTAHGSLLQPKRVQNVLLKCFVHEVANIQVVLWDYYRKVFSKQFIELLIYYGTKQIPLSFALNKSLSYFEF